MAEWNENKLEQELEHLIEDMPMQAELEQKIQQSITRRIKRTTGITVLAILLAVAVLFLCISPLMDLMFLDPTQPGKGQQKLTFAVLRDYWETTEPYVDLVSLQVEKRGFGCYDLAMQVVDRRGPVQVGKTNLWMELNRGTYENRQDAEGHFIHHMDRFEQNTDAEQKEALIRSLLELPGSSLVYLSVAEAQARNIEALRQEPVRLHWVQVYQPNVEFQGGLSMLLTAAYEQEDRRESLSAEELLQVYRSNLKNLLDHREIWEAFHLTDGSSITYTAASGVLEKTYEDAQTLQALTVQNYCISGTRDEIIAYLQRTEVTSVRVDEVRLSKWN